MAQTKLRREQLNYGTMLIEDINLTGGTQASFDFQSIPATFRSLRLDYSLRSNQAASNDYANLRFNNDSGSNYDVVRHVIQSSVDGPSETLGATNIRFRVCAASSESGDYGQGSMLINNYASVNMNKSGNLITGLRFTSGADALQLINIYWNWRSSAAISRITILEPEDGTLWAQYSRVTLYGII